MIFIEVTTLARGIKKVHWPLPLPPKSIFRVLTWSLGLNRGQEVCIAKLFRSRSSPGLAVLWLITTVWHQSPHKVVHGVVSHGKSIQGINSLCHWTPEHRLSCSLCVEFLEKCQLLGVHRFSSWKAKGRHKSLLLLTGQLPVNRTEE